MIRQKALQTELNIMMLLAIFTVLDTVQDVATIILSISAFSLDVIDRYFDGNPKEANAAEYLMWLREARKKKLRAVRERFESDETD